MDKEKYICRGGPPRLAELVDARRAKLVDWVYYQPRWRNWQTRNVEVVVPVKGVEVRVLSSAPFFTKLFKK